jgi:hypothetical protein
MLEEWWRTPDRGVLVVDSSNEERDHLNALAQARRLEAGELGADALPLENGRELRASDRVLFNAIYRPAPERPAVERPKRVENGTPATVVSVDLEAGTAVVRLHEPRSKRARGPQEDPELTVPASAPIELGYARRVVKAQGMTADVANVATGPPHGPQRALHDDHPEPGRHQDPRAPGRAGGHGRGPEQPGAAGRSTAASGTKTFWPSCGLAVTRWGRPPRRRSAAHSIRRSARHSARSTQGRNPGRCRRAPCRGAPSKRRSRPPARGGGDSHHSRDRDARAAIQHEAGHRPPVVG